MDDEDKSLKLKNKNLKTRFTSPPRSLSTKSGSSSSAGNSCNDKIEDHHSTSSGTIITHSSDKSERKSVTFKTFEPVKKYVLSSLTSSALRCALEETIEELIILGYIRNLPRVTASLTYETLEQRFKDKPTNLLFDPETIESCESALEKEKYAKVQRDRSYVEKVLQETIISLKKSNSYDVLVTLIEEHYQKVFEEDLLLKNEPLNRLKLKDLQKALITERKEMLQEIDVQSKYVEELKDEFEDILTDIRVKTNYVEKWENARMEQNSYKLYLEENNYEVLIRELNSKIEREIRVNAEMEAFIRETQQEYENQIKSWREHFYETLELKDNQIQSISKQREVQLTNLQDLKDSYDQRQKEMDNFVTERDERIRQIELLQLRNKMAKKVQRWWKRIMIVRCLGPYNPNKQKKGKDAKNSGKKKGKK